MEGLKRLFRLLIVAWAPAAFGASLSGEVVAPRDFREVIVYLEPLGPVAEGPPQEVVVTQRGRQFDPPLTIVRRGDRVVWINDEEREIDHNIYSLSPVTAFDLGLGERGSRLSQRFDDAGTINYYCSVHKNMEGRLVILPSRHYALIDAPGSFVLDGIPPGRWRLTATLAHRRYRVAPVEIEVAGDLAGLHLEVVKR